MVIERYGVEHYRGTHGIQPASLAAALGLSTALVGGLLLASPTFQKQVGDILIVENIPLAQPTIDPPPEVKPTVRAKVQPNPRPKPLDTSEPVTTAIGEQPFVVSAGPGTPGATGLDPITILPPLPTPTPSPVLTGVGLDARYARDLQPPYPSSEQRAGREGLVSVRVLVGVDGRVKQVERIAAASDAFFAATERQALGRWRFRPATRDGVPIEGWRTMTVRFVMPAE
jgi:protein TonB